MTAQSKATPRNTTRAEAQAAPEREVLGSMDIGVGLPADAWDSTPNGIPNAMDAVAPSWERKTALDKATPQARPGYRQRWVRIANAEGKPDVANKAEALMAGWRPRREGSLSSSDIGMPIYDAGDGRGGVLIFKEQLLLCEIREETAQAMEAQLAAGQEQINKTIYQETKRGMNVPAKYGTLEHESGRSSAGLID